MNFSKISYSIFKRTFLSCLCYIAIINGSIDNHTQPIEITINAPLLCHYFYDWCTTKNFPQDSFMVDFFSSTNLLDKKQLRIKIVSFVSTILNFNFCKHTLNDNYKILAVPYNRQYNFFEEDGCASKKFLGNNNEFNPEFTWENIKKYQDENKYKIENEEKYISGVFRYKESVFLRFNIYLPEEENY